MRIYERIYDKDGVRYEELDGSSEDFERVILVDMTEKILGITQTHDNHNAAVRVGFDSFLFQGRKTPRFEVEVRGLNSFYDVRTLATIIACGSQDENLRIKNRTENSIHYTTLFGDLHVSVHALTAR